MTKKYINDRIHKMRWGKTYRFEFKHEGKTYILNNMSEDIKGMILYSAPGVEVEHVGTANTKAEFVDFIYEHIYEN